ncbi:expressed unknown protein [Seminavis robusta]|uniref:Uncharacterized protein n=1 Tax=Seminavis robusta TaxID=568900 RepID=A0A9N8HI31_9STRA|nr:expressed unknown protein [Seminavis robusta]|eukprot:Sro569_g168250.1 n/a (166) ;mRNA; f:1309-1806
MSFFFSIAQSVEIPWAIIFTKVLKHFQMTPQSSRGTGILMPEATIIMYPFQHTQVPLSCSINGGQAAPTAAILPSPFQDSQMATSCSPGTNSASPGAAVFSCPHSTARCPPFAAMSQVDSSREQTMICGLALWPTGGSSGAFPRFPLPSVLTSSHASNRKDEIEK